MITLNNIEDIGMIGLEEDVGSYLITLRKIWDIGRIRRRRRRR